MLLFATVLQLDKIPPKKIWLILFSNTSQFIKISTKVKVSTWTNLILFVKFSEGRMIPLVPKRRRKMKLLLHKKTSERCPRTTMTILAATAVVVMLVVLAWMKKKNKYRIKYYLECQIRCCLLSAQLPLNFHGFCWFCDRKSYWGRLRKSAYKIAKKCKNNLETLLHVAPEGVRWLFSSNLALFGSLFQAFCESHIRFCQFCPGLFRANIHQIGRKVIEKMWTELFRLRTVQ